LVPFFLGDSNCCPDGLLRGLAYVAGGRRAIENVSDEAWYLEGTIDANRLLDRLLPLGALFLFRKLPLHCPDCNNRVNRISLPKAEI
jgi:hypothetical protein